GAQRPRIRFHISVLRLGREAVADAGVGVDVAVAGGAAVDLGPQLADADVDRAVALRVRHAPDAAAQLVAAERAPALGGHRVQEPELEHREAGVLAVDEGPPELRIDHEPGRLDGAFRAPEPAGG